MRSQLSKTMNSFILIALLCLVVILIFILLRSSQISMSTASSDVVPTPAAAPPSNAASIVVTVTPQPTSAVQTPLPDETATPDLDPTMTEVSLPVEPSPDPSTPYILQVALDRDTNTEMLTEASDVVVLGTVSKVLPARWTTENGDRPDNPWKRKHSIYTPIVFTAQQYIKGISTEVTLILLACGGTVGKDSFVCNGEGENGLDIKSFSPNQKLLLFISNTVSLNKMNIRSIYERYTVNTSGQATNRDRTINLSDLIAGIRNPMATVIPTIVN